MLDKYGYPVKSEPPLPALAKPDPVTIHDLSPEDRSRAVIYSAFGTNKWKFPESE